MSVNSAFLDCGNKMCLISLWFIALTAIIYNQAPDYHRVIKHPMDLGTMKYKLNTIQYKTAEDFVKDLQLMFTNCFTYNNDAADEYK